DTAGYNADLYQRVGVFKEPTGYRVACFVEGDDFLFLRRDNFVFLFKPSDYAVDSILKVLHFDGLLLATRGDERGLVTYVGNFRASKARCLRGELLGVNRRVELDRPKVSFENCLAAYDIGFVNADLTVKTPRAQQSRVEYVRAVGRSQNNNARVGSKTIHLDQQRVQRVLAFIVGAGKLTPSA